MTQAHSKPLDSWTMGSQEGLASVIRRVTGLDAQTAGDITRDAAENGEAAFMTATVLIIGTAEITETQHPVPGRRGLARWKAHGAPGWRLLLMARDT